MNIKIPVFQTLLDAFALMADRKDVFFKALVIPVLVLITMQIILFFMVEENYLSWGQLLDLTRGFLPKDTTTSASVLFLFTTLLLIYMMDFSSRIAITQTLGQMDWRFSETQTTRQLIGFILLPIFVVVILVAISFIVFVLDLEYAQRNPRFSSTAMVIAMGCAGMTFVIFYLYLYARFIFVFPAIAMWNKISFSEAWVLSRGNGWRLVLFTLVPIGFCIMVSPLAFLLPIRIFIVIFGILSIALSMVAAIAISLAYKQLKV